MMEVCTTDLLLPLLLQAVEVRVSGRVDALEVGAWRPSLGLQLKVEVHDKGINVGLVMCVTAGHQKPKITMVCFYTILLSFIIT